MRISAAQRVVGAGPGFLPDALQRLTRRDRLAVLGAAHHQIRRFGHDLIGARAQRLRYGMATLCVGGGMGIATIVERI